MIVTEYDVGYYWAFAGERKCEWCGNSATRASHDGCYFCSRCAMPGDMVLPERPRDGQKNTS